MKTGKMSNKGNTVRRASNKVAVGANRTGGTQRPGGTTVRGGNTKKPFAQLPGKSKGRTMASKKMSLRKMGA